MIFERMIQLGGIFYFILAVFHLFYPRLFKWESNLKGLDVKRKDVIKQNLYVSNASMLVLWLFFSFLSLFYAKELLSTSIGKGILIGIVIFWIIRIFIIQPIYIGMKTKKSIIRVIFFIIGAAFYLIPLVSLIFV